MRVKEHIISAVPFGIGYFLISRDLTATAIAVATTILLDIDHAADYVVIQKHIPSLRKMTEAFKSFGIISKNYLWLHSWEFVFILAGLLYFFPNRYGTAVFCGFTLHLLIDQIHNTCCMGKYNLKPLFYFLLYRIFMKFEVLKLRQKGDSIAKGERIYK